MKKEIKFIQANTDQMEEKKPTIHLTLSIKTLQERKAFKEHIKDKSVKELLYDTEYLKSMENALKELSPINKLKETYKSLQKTFYPEFEYSKTLYNESLFGFSYQSYPIEQYAQKQQNQLYQQLENITTLFKPTSYYEEFQKISIPSIQDYINDLIQKEQNAMAQWRQNIEQYIKSPSKYLEEIKEVFTAVKYLFKSTIHLKTDEKLTIEEKAKAIDNTAELIYDYIVENFTKTSPVIEKSDRIIENLKDITYNSEYVKNRYAKVKAFSNYLNLANMNWIEEREGKIYYTDIYRVSILFLHIYEVIAEEIKKSYKPLISSKFNHIVELDDTTIQQTIQYIKLMKKISTHNYRIKNSAYNFIVYIISDKMGIDFEHLINIFRYLLFYQTKNKKNEKLPLITPQKEDIDKINSIISKELENIISL